MASLKHLVVVVPGIGGSVLQTAEGAARWDEHRRRFAAAVTRPHRLGLDTHPDLVPVGLMPDITLVGPFVVPGYDGLVRKIRNRFDDVQVDVSLPGREPDHRADLVLFPYDFRHSIRHAAERLAADVAARLSGEHSGARRRRVIVVAHSMGGLVARYWLGPLGGAAHCAALITLGTPHRGAPKALDVLANGLKVGPKRLAGLTEVLRQWPSAYELLPRYQTVARPDGVEPLRPYELEEGTGADGTGPDALVDASFVSRAKTAFGVHQDIEAAWTELLGSPDCPEVTAAFGRGHATLQQALLSPAGLSVTKGAPSWLPNPDWLGDGTVPAISAIPIEQRDMRARRAVPERHMALASSSVVVDMLTEYAGASLESVRGDEPDRPWLGLDLDDTALSGDPVAVGVTLHGVQADERTHVRIRLRARDSRQKGATAWLPCTRSGDDQWRADLLPPGAGTYTVEVAATGVPVVDRLQAGDVLGVVDAGYEGAGS
ncbi:esterase/lipase family protein [Streptomyces sp. NPDC001668]|uniref:esterase/lipase family protein n=1 Tax=unclassified Streptomyces TaxID=2593676 RepID=UPI0036BA9231